MEAYWPVQQQHDETVSMMATAIATVAAADNDETEHKICKQWVLEVLRLTDFACFSDYSNQQNGKQQQIS